MVYPGLPLELPSLPRLLGLMHRSKRCYLLWSHLILCASLVGAIKPHGKLVSWRDNGNKQGDEQMWLSQLQRSSFVEENV